jgi:hypothetical protein
MPPSRAIAIANVASVTVSIAAEIIGIFNEISLVSFVLIFTSRGSTCENAGSNSTSSNVNPSPKNLDGKFAFVSGIFILAMCKDNAVGKFTPKDFLVNGEWAMIKLFYRLVETPTEIIF